MLDTEKIYRIKKANHVDAPYVEHMIKRHYGNQLKSYQWVQQDDWDHTDLTIQINDIFYKIDIKCAADNNKQTGNFTIPAYYMESVYKEPNSYFAFIDQTVECNGYIYIIKKEHVYNCIQKGLFREICNKQAYLITKQFVRNPENLLNNCALLSDDIDIKCLQHLYERYNNILIKQINTTKNDYNSVSF